MEQYIPKSVVLAELKKRIRDYWSDSENTMGIYPYALEEIIKYIDTLEVKEVDLDKEIKEYINDEWCDEWSGDVGNWIRCRRGTTPMEVEDVKDIAKHFFELGLKAKNNQDKWNKTNTKPPFTTTMDGNKYSDTMLCYDKFGNYCIAQYVRLHTGHCGWYDGEEEVSITHWKELKVQKGEEV